MKLTSPLNCILQHQSFWHMIMCSIILFMSSVFMCKMRRAFANISLSPVSLELRHKDVKQKKWRKPAGETLQVAYPPSFLPFLPEPTELLYSPALEIMRQSAGRRDISGKDWAGLTRKSSDSACAPSLPSVLSGTQTRCWRWKRHCVTLRGWTWGQKHMAQVTRGVAHSQASCYIEIHKKKTLS